MAKSTGCNAMAKKPNKANKIEPDAHRGRIDLRAEPEFVARIERQSRRLGLSLSGYVRLAVSRQLEADEATEPKAAK
jgi:hypothetical protein